MFKKFEDCINQFRKVDNFYSKGHFSFAEVVGKDLDEKLWDYITSRLKPERICVCVDEDLHCLVPLDPNSITIVIPSLLDPKVVDILFHPWYN